MPKYLQKIAEISERGYQITGKSDSSLATSNLLKMMTLGGNGSMFNNPELAGKLMSGMSSTFSNASNPLTDFYNRQAIMATGVTDAINIEKQMENIDSNPAAQDKRRQFALRRVSSQFGSIKTDRNSRREAMHQLMNIYGTSANIADKMLNSYDEETGDITFSGKGKKGGFDVKMLEGRAKERTGGFELGETILADVSAKAGAELGKSIAEAILPGQIAVAQVISDLFFKKNPDSDITTKISDYFSIGKKSPKGGNRVPRRGGSDGGW
jgi:hypothetical protein